MKRVFFMIGLALMTCMTIGAQGINFSKEPYAELLKQAKEQDKLIFVDVFTSWCGPCKHMAKEIFPLEEAGNFYNEKFINLQVDAEKSEDGQFIAKNFAVTAFPTFLFINGDGELAYRFMGTRTIDKFLAEGESALSAAASMPKLKEYDAKYAAGDRDKDFLEAYCDLRVKSGLDCGNIIIEYLGQVSDNELLDSVQVDRISKATVYDRDFTGRLINVVVSDSAELNQDAKRLSTVNKAVCSYMTAALSDVTRKGDDNGFEELMDFKKDYFGKSGNKETVILAALGGGNIYLPSNLTRLKFYVMRKNADKFNPLFVSYMEDLQKKYEENYAKKQEMEAEIEKKLKESQESGDNEEYDNLKKAYRMAFAFSKFDDNYVTSEMVDLIPYYESFYTGEQDNEFKNKLAGYYVTLCQLSPSAKTAIGVADKLIELGDNENAIKILQAGVDEGKDAVGVEDSDIEAARAKLEELRK